MSIRKLPSGKYQARYTAPDGTRHPLGTFPTKKDAQKALMAKAAEITVVGWIDQSKARTTFEEFAWIVFEHKRHSLKASTANNYRALLKRALLPTFGPIPLEDIRPRFIDEWFASYEGGLVNRHRAYGLLHHYLNFAVRWEYLRSNPAMVEGGFADRSTPRPAWAVSDFLKVLAEADEAFTTMLLTAFAGHLRAGEVLGLNVGDFEPRSGVLTVSRALSSSIGMTTTKNGDAKVVTLLDQGAEALRKHVEIRESIGDTPMFVTEHGNRPNHNWLGKRWHSTCDAAGVEGMRFHDLRHISLTHIAHTGASVKEIMSRGGHRSVTAAMRYQAATRARDIEIAKSASALLATS